MEVKEIRVYDYYLYYYDMLPWIQELEDVQEKQRQLSKELKDTQQQRKKATDEFTDLNEKYARIIVAHVLNNLFIRRFLQFF